MPFRFNPSDSLATIHQQWLRHHARRSEILAKNPRLAVLDVMATDFASPLLHDFEHLAMNQWRGKSAWVSTPRKYHEAMADAFGNVARFYTQYQRYPNTAEFTTLFKQGEYPELHLNHPETLKHHQAWVVHQHKQLWQSLAYQQLPPVKKYRDATTTQAYRKFMNTHRFDELFPPPARVDSSAPSAPASRLDTIV
jgi:hypothetical protein